MLQSTKAVGSYKISWINYWMTVVHNNVLPPRYFLWGSHNMLQCYFLTHRSNITHLSISVYDSLRTVPVKQCHCRCCDPWLVYTAHNVRDAPKKHLTHSLGTHSTDTLSQKHTVASRNYMIQHLNYSGSRASNWQVYEEIDTEAGLLGLGSWVDTVTMDSDANISFPGAIYFYL